MDLRTVCLSPSSGSKKTSVAVITSNIRTIVTSTAEAAARALVVVTSLNVGKSRMTSPLRLCIRPKRSQSRSGCMLHFTALRPQTSTSSHHDFTDLSASSRPACHWKPLFLPRSSNVPWWTASMPQQRALLPLLLPRPCLGICRGNLRKSGKR